MDFHQIVEEFISLKHWHRNDSNIWWGKYRLYVQLNNIYLSQWEAKFQIYTYNYYICDIDPNSSFDLFDPALVGDKGYSLNRIYNGTSIQIKLQRAHCIIKKSQFDCVKRTDDQASGRKPINFINTFKHI